MSNREPVDLETRAALTDLAYRYAQAVDRCDAAALVELFTADGRIGGMDDTVPAFSGHDGLRQMVKQVDTSFLKTMHNVFNQTFERTQDERATGETYCVASHVIAKSDGSWDLLDMAIRYHNDYEREQGVWKFSRRRLEVEWIETRPVAPMDPAFLAAR